MTPIDHLADGLAAELPEGVASGFVWALFRELEAMDGADLKQTLAALRERFYRMDELAAICIAEFLDDLTDLEYLDAA